MQLMGYIRENGDVGFRNHVLVLSTVVCSAETVRRLATGLDGVTFAIHVHGCGHLGDDYQQAVRTLVGSGTNPNIAAVLVIGLGCEKVQAADLAAEIAKSGKPVAYLDIQNEGGTEKTLARGRKILQQMLIHAAKQERRPVDMSRLIVGLNCGGSDTFSGLAANPAIGETSNRIVAAGGTVLLGEVSEFIGAEHVLAGRAADSFVAEEIRRIVRACEDELMAAKVDIRGSQPSPGNIRGGITTIEEKSLGAIHKCGSSAIVEVVPFAERPSRQGVVIMDGPAQDVICNTGMTASGAQIVLFTTGLGTPVGSPIAPVIKLTGTRRTFEQMLDNIDISVHPVIEGNESITEAGDRILDYLCSVLNGELTKAEQLGYQEFDFWRIGPCT